MKSNFKYIQILVTLTICQSAFVQQISSQVNTLQKSQYHFIDLQNKQNWTGSYNAGGLHFLDFSNVSYAEAYMGKNNGSFVKYNESNNSIDYGIKAESYSKIKNTVYYGKLDYNKFTGQNMTWSGQIYPERYMVSVADDNPTEKTKESYKLAGGISTPLFDKMLFGFKINYEVANLAKRKDLRHKTDLLDLETTAGLVYGTKYLNIGANYYYRKYFEDVTFSKIGDNDNVYNGYLFKGLWFGITDSWSQDVLELSRPFTDVINGVSFQLEFLVNNLKFFNEITFKRQEGFTGPGANKNYSESNANIYEYKGILQYEKEKIRQYLRVNSCYTDAVNYDRITNRENVGGIYVVLYYGLNKAFSKRSFNLSAEYEISAGKNKFNPAWNLKTGIDYYSNTAVSSLINPFYFTQELKIYSEYMQFNKNFTWSKGMADMSLTVRHSKGWGDKLSRHISESASEETSEDIIPYQNTDLLNREYEFLTTGKFNLGAGIRYSRFVKAGKRSGTVYIDTKYTFTKAGEIIYNNGNSAGVFNLALGFLF